MLFLVTSTMAQVLISLSFVRIAVANSLSSSTSYLVADILQRSNVLLVGSI